MSGGCEGGGLAIGGIGGVVGIYQRWGGCR